MLEKIGLPPKPSMRGNNWVVDASHCQGCSSQFTFINRKHHCRRCGGLFCNSCTLQRMILRGQGDSPVRICDPCKKLEDAARFELRYGHKNRAGTGSSRHVTKSEDEVINQILGIEGKQRPLLPIGESTANAFSDLQRGMSSASCSNLREESASQDEDRGTTLRSISADMHNYTPNEMESSTPDNLRQQALEEKKKYKILKGEGKSEEALRAFKRSKELERQAGALDIALRKSRRMASASASSSLAGIEKAHDNLEGSGRKKKLSSQMGNEKKNDLAFELRELGWSDADLHDAEKKPEKMSLEGELSNLLREVPQKPNLDKKSSGIDKSQVLAHKKKALMFKREGKLVEAKEELKRAKVLEKQLEEQEFLAEAEESDDELSSLICSMDDDKQDDFLMDYAHDSSIEFNRLGEVSDDLHIVGNLEVTDDDLNDPEMAAALKAFGWTEDADQLDPEENVLHPNSMDREALRSEVRSLKREALNQKRAGNVSEAMTQLKKAKQLEKDLEILESQGLSSTAAPNPGQSSKSVVVNDENIIAMEYKPPRKSKLVIQKELLALKKKALALRREGRLDEAEEELKKGQVLERQLEEMENTPIAVAAKGNVGKMNLESEHKCEDVAEVFDIGEGEDLTEQDLHDPALLSQLLNLGWKDEAAAVPADETNSLKRGALNQKWTGNVSEAMTQLKKAKQLEQDLEIMESQGLSSTAAPNPGQTSKSVVVNDENIITMEYIPPRKSKLVIQRELLALKKKALALRREGRLDEAEEELKKGQVLERLEEMENTPIAVAAKGNVGKKNLESERKRVDVAEVFDIGEGEDLTKQDLHDPTLLSQLSNLGWKDEAAAVPADETNSAQGSDFHKNQSPRQEILARKRKALALKREGKLAEAREDLLQAKILEKSLEEELDSGAGTNNVSVLTVTDDLSVQENRKKTDNIPVQESRKFPAAKPKSSRDRFKMQQESLSHKRNALKLRREGRIEESEAELELAKALEKQLEESGAHDTSTSNSNKETGAMDDVVVEDLLDPQLMSMLKGIGWQENDVVTLAPEIPEVKSIAVKSENVRLGKSQIEDQIKAEKVRALNLKRAGNQAEALDALRRAKQLEKKLNSLAS